MQTKQKHTLGFMSLIEIYAPIEICETEEMFYAKLGFEWEQSLTGCIQFLKTSMLQLGSLWL